MKKMKFLSAFIAVFMLISISVYAAPTVIYPGEQSGSGDFIVIQNPPTDKAATFDKSYIISGYGKAGTNVYIYKLVNGVYQKTNYSWSIGASEMFFKRLELDKGKNSLICYAESNGSSQSVALEITYLGTALSNKINDIKIDLGSLF